MRCLASTEDIETARRWLEVGVASDKSCFHHFRGTPIGSTRLFELSLTSRRTNNLYMPMHIYVLPSRATHRHHCSRDGSSATKVRTNCVHGSQRQSATIAAVVSFGLGCLRWPKGTVEKMCAHHTHIAVLRPCQKSCCRVARTGHSPASCPGELRPKGGRDPIPS